MQEYDALWQTLASHLQYDTPSGPRYYAPYPPRRELVALLQELQALPPGETYRAIYISDTHYLLGDVPAALDAHPSPTPSQRSSGLTSWRLNLKDALGLPCAAVDLLTLFDKRLTRFGREHLAEVQACLDLLLAAWADSHGEDLLAHTVRTNPELRCRRHGFYTGSPFNMYWTEPVHYSFYEVPSLAATASELAREAENMVRDGTDAPRVGERWVSEMELLMLVRACLAPLEVVHHARPRWLGRMHLDVYVPALQVAIEYQGRQHREPVGHFGGEEAYRETLRRDRRKKALCTRHGVRLIRVHEGYDRAEVERTLRALTR